MLTRIQIIHRENGDVLQSAIIKDPGDATSYAVGALFQKGDFMTFASGSYTVVRRVFQMDLSERTLNVYVTKIPQGDAW